MYDYKNRCFVPFYVYTQRFRRLPTSVRPLGLQPKQESLLQWRKPFSKGTRMRPLIVDSSMTSMGGTFYPTGYVFALFPDEDSTRHAPVA